MCTAHHALTHLEIEQSGIDFALDHVDNFRFLQSRTLSVPSHFPQHQIEVRKVGSVC